jgi:FkbM family methyltransferase
MPKLNILRFRLIRAAQLLPKLLSNPRWILLVLRGVSLGRLAYLDVGWVRTGQIKTVLDIGAHTGQFAQAARCVLPDAMIYSFEPLPDAYPLLTARMSKDRTFKAYGVALGEEDGETIFHRNEFTQSSSVLPMSNLHRDSFPWTQDSTQLTVPVRRLDSFLGELNLAPKVLVKIDVQGFEDRVLRGGEQVIRSADYVIVETSVELLYEGQAWFETIYSTMKDFGFRYAGSVDQLDDPRSGRPVQVDALFLCEGK